MVSKSPGAHRVACRWGVRESRSAFCTARRDCTQRLPGVRRQTGNGPASPPGARRAHDQLHARLSLAWSDDPALAESFFVVLRKRAAAGDTDADSAPEDPVVDDGPG